MTTAITTVPASTKTTAWGSIAVEDMRPGYRYVPVRDGYESAWTIETVTIHRGKGQVYRDGKWITPTLVTYTQRNGGGQTLELGEQIAIQGPWLTEDTED